MTKKYSMKQYCMFFIVLSFSTRMQGNGYAVKFLTAAQMGRLDIVEEIVAQYPHIIHLQDKEGNTALHYALNGEGFLHIVKFLVSCDIDINKPNKGGTTPLFTAVLKGWYFIVDFLIRQGADYNRANHTHWSPLFCATLNRNLEITRRLVNANARVDQNTENKIKEHFPRYDFREQRRIYRDERTHAFVVAITPKKMKRQQQSLLPNVLTKLIFEFEEGAAS